MKPKRLGVVLAFVCLVRRKGRSMTYVARSPTLAAVLLVTLLAPLPLRADPIMLTGGNVQVDRTFGEATITLVGDGFLVRTATEDFFPNFDFGPFPTATTVDLGGEWRPSAVQGGEGTFNGVHYAELYFDSQSGGTFMTPSFTLTGDDVGLFHTVELPFTFTGFVTAYSSSPFVYGPDPEDVVFTATLSGQGTARGAFFGLPPEPGRPRVFQLDDFEYIFSPAGAPIPEPGTLALLGTGALVMIAAKYRRGSKRAWRPDHRSM